jgi:phosphoglycerol transferase MdoB-like AlkP superfamily enzyme
VLAFSFNFSYFYSVERIEAFSLMSTTIARARDWLRRAMRYPAVRCIVTACVLNLLIEILNQRSLVTALSRMVSQPTLMIYNLLLILLTLSLSGLFRRQIFAMVLLSVPWLTVSIANFVLQSFRSTPLSAVDFKLLFSVIYIMDVYLTVWQMILILVVIAVAIALLVLLCIKAGRQERHWRSSIALIVVAALLVAGGTPLLLHMDILSNGYSNLNKAYHDYGLPYCFLVSVFDRGIDKPEEYSEEVVETVLQDIDDNHITPSTPDRTLHHRVPSPTEDSVIQPNVIFLQLESFIDVNYLSDLTYSENPVPFFESLKEKYPSGFLTVPTYGAGTVNTEFEVITGMNLDYFGAGEYPYITVLRDQTCESVAYNLKENGYAATAIHDNTATFYDRNLVFADLGFDRFVAEEYMYDLDYTSVGWPKDRCLTDEILKTLDSTDSLDLIYTISVQPHGKYPSDLEAELDEPIQILSGFTEEEAAEQAAYTYYVNQIKEVDDFLQELTEALFKRSEPTMLILYGDHLPNFELEESQVRTGDLFETEYVIWTNYVIEADDRDLCSYQLSSYVMGLIGVDTGLLTRLHQTEMDEESYQKDLELLEYDMLFGDQAAWGGENPYQPTELQLGYGDITLESADQIDDAVYFSGDGFNEWSTLYYDGERQDTVLINRNTLRADALPEVGTVVTVVQLAEDGTQLSSTNELTIPAGFGQAETPRTQPQTDDPEP